jgi:hypothetical protein
MLKSIKRNTFFKCLEYLYTSANAKDKILKLCLYNSFTQTKKF